MVRRIAMSALFALALFPATLAGDEVELSVDVQPRSLRQGESLIVRIEARGSGAAGVDIAGRPPQGIKLVPAGGFSSSQQVSWINGAMSARKSFEVEYLATTAGEGRVPAFTLLIDGKTRKTKPVTVRILPPSAPGPTTEQETGLSITARLARKRIYFGESVELEYVLRAFVRITDYGPKQLGQIDGFLIEDEQIEPENTARRITDASGRQGSEWTLFRRRLSPTRTGKIEIPSTVFTFLVQKSTRNRRSIFFEPQVDRISRLVPARRLEVRPLPEKGRPDDFSGAVGHYRLEAKLGSHKATAGEAVNLVVTMRGDNPPGAVSPPRIDLPQDLQVYEPLEEDAGAGARRWVFPLVPRAAGRLVIPRVHMSTFDPQSARYERLEKGPFEILVSTGRDNSGQAGAASIGGALPVRAQGADLRFIHPAPTGLLAGDLDGVASPIFWMAALVPLITLPLLVLGGTIFTRYSGSSAGRRARNARRVATLLREARSQATREPEAAARELLRAIHAWAEGILGEPSRPLDRAQLQRRLGEACGETAIATHAVGLIDRAEGVRYGGRSTGEDLAKLIEETQRLVSGMNPR